MPHAKRGGRKIKALSKTVPQLEAKCGRGGGERGFRGTVRGASPYTGKWGALSFGCCPGVSFLHFILER